MNANIDVLLIFAARRTPLHLSMSFESSKCAKQLVKKLEVVDLNEADNEMMTAAHWSALHDRVKHLDLLIQGVSLLVWHPEAHRYGRGQICQHEIARGSLLCTGLQPIKL